MISQATGRISRWGLLQTDIEYIVLHIIQLGLLRRPTQWPFPGSLPDYGPRGEFTVKAGRAKAGPPPPGPGKLGWSGGICERQVLGWSGRAGAGYSSPPPPPIAWWRDTQNTQYIRDCVFLQGNSWRSIATI